MWSKVSAYSLIILSLLVSACHQKEPQSPLVASVYGHELHLSDLDGLVADGVSAEDSASIIDNYVDQWVRQTVLLCKAEKNVKDNFDRQMGEYRNSLLTYAYEQQILNQLMDTLVSEAQIEAYYNQHQDDFQLKNSIVKVVYAIAPKNFGAKEKINQVVKKQVFRDEDMVSPTPGKPVTWLPFVMRLPEGSAAADTYDVCEAQSYNATGGNQNRVFTNWMMEGSVDGLHWDILSETNNAQPLASVWVGSGVTYNGKSSDTTHLNGMKLARSGIGEIATTVLDDVTTVSVATNCTLEAEGDVTLKALTLDANGNGTIKGFAFAESGTVDVAGLGVGVKEATFDITFEDVTGLQNIKSWNLTVNGGRAVNRRLVVGSDGTVRLVRRGLSFAIR